MKLLDEPRTSHVLEGDDAFQCGISCSVVPVLYSLLGTNRSSEIQLRGGTAVYA